ncbi:MAG: ABC transporter permease [Chloroflexi bacterium]|nr:ABC transporter permease [Chloroflexota bacterium]MYD49608.1 ABC transporter permease [Chloroflexota bacterium]
MLTNPAIYLTWMSIRMWLRDRAALFWTFFLPMVIMVIFGLLNFGELGKVNLGIVDLAQNETSARFVERAQGMESLRITTGSENGELDALTNGRRDLVLILPENFGPAAGSRDAEWQPVAIRVLYHGSRPAESQVGLSLLQSGIDEINFALTGTERLVTLESEAVAARDLGYIDFLMPGVIGMAIMQLGLFSVAFSFVTMKREGVLRRLLATPLNPATLLSAQVVTRLIAVMLQTLILASVAVFIFGAEFAGNFFAVLLAAGLGGAVFLALGFAVSGWARTEQQAAPLANIVSLPMMFLSGVFFSRDVLPGILQTVTDYLPLTFLVEAIRGMTVQGDSIITQWPNFLGMAVWFVIAFIIANRTFRWE